MADPIAHRIRSAFHAGRRTGSLTVAFGRRRPGPGEHHRAWWGRQPQVIDRRGVSGTVHPAVKATGGADFTEPVAVIHIGVVGGRSAPPPAVLREQIAQLANPAVCLLAPWMELPTAEILGVLAELVVSANGPAAVSPVVVSPVVVSPAVVVSAFAPWIYPAGRRDRRVETEGLVVRMSPTADGVGVPEVVQLVHPPGYDQRHQVLHPATMVPTGSLSPACIVTTPEVLLGWLANLPPSLASVALDPHVVALDLAAHLRATDAAVGVVPALTVVEPVVRPWSKRALAPIVAGSSRLAPLVVGRGPSLLLDRPRRSAEQPLRLAFTTAVPSEKAAHRWGDWYLAEALAAATTARGHQARVFSFDHRHDVAARVADVEVVVRGLAPTVPTRHRPQVLWIVSHPDSVEDHELHAASLVLTASARLADSLAQRTDTPVEVLLQATDQRRFRPRVRTLDREYRAEGAALSVWAVAKTRGVARPVVLDAVEAGLEPSIVGSGWEHLVPPHLLVTDHLDNARVAEVYANADLVLNDHWDDMRTWGIVSNRVFDVLACGTPLASDPMPELHELFGDAVAEVRGPADLKMLGQSLREDPQMWHKRLTDARAVVLGGHTFDHRAAELLAAIERHGLVSGGT